MSATVRKLDSTETQELSTQPLNILRMTPEASRSIKSNRQLLPQAIAALACLISEVRKHQRKKGTVNHGPLLVCCQSVAQTIHMSDCWISTPLNHLPLEIMLSPQGCSGLLSNRSGFDWSSSCWFGNWSHCGFTASSTCSAASIATSTVTGAWVAASLNWSADNSWHAASHRNANLTRNALCTSDSACLTNLTANCVRNFASAGLLFHLADGVRNLLCAAFCNHLASCVRNTASNALLGPCAGRVRNLLRAGLLCHCAGCVRNLLGACFLCERAGCVRNLLRCCDRNLTADGIWNLLVADFRNHASAGHSLLNNLWNPLAAGDSA